MQEWGPSGVKGRGGRWPRTRAMVWLPEGRHNDEEGREKEMREREIRTK